MSREVELIDRIQGMIADYKKATPQEPTDPAEVVTVDMASGDNLKRAIDTALTKAQLKPVKVVLAPGNYRGRFTIPNDTPNVITYTAPPELLPSAGSRMTPNYEGKLPRIDSDNGETPLLVVGSNLVFRGIEGAPLADQGATHFSVEGHEVTDPAKFPRNITFAQILVRGGDITSPTPGGHRGVAMNGENVQVLDSWIDRMAEVGRDAQACGAWNTPGKLRVQNCYLEATGENFMIGGSRPVSGLCPTEVDLIGCTIMKDLAWRTWPINLSIKNSVELKFCRKFRMHGNFIRYNWADSQTGWTILLTTKGNTSAANLGPWCIIDDVDISGNIIKDVSGGLNMAAGDGPLRNVRIAHNVWDNLDRATYGGDGAFLQLGTVNVENIAITHQTILLVTGSRWGAFYGDQTVKMKGFSLTHSLMQERSYGIHGPAGSGWDAFIALMEGYDMRDNAIVDDVARKLPWPPGNFLLPSGTDWRTMFDKDYKQIAGSPISALPTSDGKLIGADPAMLAQALSNAR